MLSRAYDQGGGRQLAGRRLRQDSLPARRGFNMVTAA